jgi:MFS family permease
LLFPESPRWLIDHNHSDLGLKTLANLHAHGNTHDAWVQAEFSQIQESLQTEHEVAAKSYKEILKNRSSFRRLVLAMALQASVQMTGVSAIQYYSVSIYAQMGISGSNALKYQAYNSIIALFAQFLCMMFIDRFGRRRPLILGNLFNMLTFIIATILLARFPPGQLHNEQAAWAFIAMTWLFNFSFSATCGPLSWIIPAEIFDMKTRALGVGVATMTSFAFNTMIGQTTSVAMQNIGYRWYYLFCVSLFPTLLDR